MPCVCRVRGLLCPLSTHSVLFTNIKTALFTSHRTRLREGSAACRGHRPHFKSVRCDVNQKVLMEVNNTECVPECWCRVRARVRAGDCSGAMPRRSTEFLPRGTPGTRGTRKACLYGSVKALTRFFPREY